MQLKINLLSVFVSVKRVLLKVALVSWGSLHGPNTQCYVRGALSAAGAAVRYRLLGWKLNRAARAKCCGVSFLSAEPSSALGKRVAEPQKGEHAGEVRLWESVECVVAEGRGSRSRGSHKISLPLLARSLATIQPTPYLIALISILSRGVPPAPLLCTF